MSGTEDAAAVVAGALSRRKPGERGRFLRELLAHTAAGLVVIEGEAGRIELPTSALPIARILIEYLRSRTII